MDRQYSLLMIMQCFVVNVHTVYPAFIKSELEIISP